MGDLVFNGGNKNLHRHILSKLSFVFTGKFGIWGGNQQFVTLINSFLALFNVNIPYQDSPCGISPLIMPKRRFIACGIGVSRNFFIQVIALHLFLLRSGWTYQDVKFNNCQVNYNRDPQ